MACPPFEVDPDDDATLLHPTLVAEVLSPSTEAFDRGDKFIAYRAIPSLQHYLVVSQDEPRIEHFVRDEGEAWRLVTLRAEDALVLDKLAITIRVADLYAGLPATPVADP